MAELATSIAAVTVYPDRARVTRTGQIHLEAGAQVLEVTNLPLQMEVKSVRASARGSARARLGGVQVRRTTYQEAPAAQVQELESQLEALQDQLQALEGRLQLLQLERNRLEALSSHTQTYATALAAGEMTLEQQLTLLEGLHQRSEVLSARELALKGEKRGLERKLQLLKQKLEELRSQRPHQRFTAQIEVEVQQAGDLQVMLNYVVAQAGWQPLYDLRLMEEGDQPTLEVSYLGQVVQQSGENWENIQLVLSTARPALSETVPELSPWFIGPRQVVFAAPAPRAMKAAASLAAMAAEPEAEAFADADLAVAEVHSSATAVTYRLPLPANLPSDGAAHKVVIARFSLPLKLDYRTAPRVAPAVYRRAQVTNDSPYTLLPGSANLFSEEDFIGATTLPLTAPQGELQLFFGVEDRIKVERELRRHEADKPLLGGKRRRSSGFEIKLENHLPFPATLTVQDQFPVSRHEEIKVRLESVEPRPTSQSELNLLEWELTLAPQEKRSLRFDFVVEYPTSMEIEGL